MGAKEKSTNKTSKVSSKGGDYKDKTSDELSESIFEKVDERSLPEWASNAMTSYQQLNASLRKQSDDGYQKLFFAFIEGIAQDFYGIEKKVDEFMTTIKEEIETQVAPMLEANEKNKKEYETQKQQLKAVLDKVGSSIQKLIAQKMQEFKDSYSKEEFPKEFKKLMENYMKETLNQRFAGLTDFFGKADENAKKALEQIASIEKSIEELKTKGIAKEAIEKLAKSVKEAKDAYETGVKELKSATDGNKKSYDDLKKAFDVKIKEVGELKKTIEGNSAEYKKLKDYLDSKTKEIDVLKKDVASAKDLAEKIKEIEKRPVFDQNQFADLAMQLKELIPKAVQKELKYIKPATKTEESKPANKPEPKPEAKKKQEESSEEKSKDPWAGKTEKKPEKKEEVKKPEPKNEEPKKTPDEPKMESEKKDNPGSLADMLKFDEDE